MSNVNTLSMVTSDQSITVLHVDDEPDFAEMVASFLASVDECFKIRTAHSPDAGERMLGDRTVDCVVSDYEMPGRDGIEFLRSVRAEHPNLPFILYTGRGSEEVASEAISAGATDYLQKQSGTEQYELLANRIRNAVGRYNTEQEFQRRSRAIETSTDGIALLDENGRYTFVNQAHADIYGYNDPATLRGETWRRCYDDDRVEWFESEVLPAVEETGQWRGEAVGTRHDGTTFPQEVSLTGLDDGGLICVVRDVSARKRQERALGLLHDTTQRLITLRDAQSVADAAVEAARTALDRPLSALWLYDDERDHLAPAAISEAGRELIGDPPAYTGDGSLSWRAFQDRELRVYDDLDSGVEPLNPDTPIRSEIIVPLGEYGVLNLGSTEAEDFTSVDVSLARTLGKTVEAALSRATRERQLRHHRDELERQNRRLERIINAISHGLRSPLNVATGQLELAQEHGDDHLDDVAVALERIETLTDDLVTLATERERASETAPVDIAEAADACWRNVVTDGATLEVETDLTVRADPGRLHQVLENLFQNAVEHGGEGSPAATANGEPERSGLTVTVGSCEGGFYVADNGTGVPREDRDRVFETGHSTSEAGTGYGLSIAREIANAHGWEVRVVDSDRGGARFEVTGVETAAGA